MKHFIQTFLLILSGGLLFSASCKKDKVSEGLPPLTFEGKNTIGCKINGVPWVPKGIFGGGVAIYPTSGGYYGTFNSPLIHIWIKTNDASSHINLYVWNYNSYYYVAPGKYFCNRNTSSLPFGYGEKHTYGTYWINNKEYITDSLHTGWIEIIKSDSINKIVSGLFEFDAYNATDGKVFKITDGRFDYKSH
jgi:hypothetical protein